MVGANEHSWLSLCAQLIDPITAGRSRAPLTRLDDEQRLPLKCDTHPRTHRAGVSHSQRARTPLQALANSRRRQFWSADL